MKKKTLLLSIIMSVTLGVLCVGNLISIDKFAHRNDVVSYYYHNVVGPGEIQPEDV